MPPKPSVVIAKPATLTAASHVHRFPVSKTSQTGTWLAAPEGKASPVYSDSLDSFVALCSDVMNHIQTMVDDTSFATPEHYEIFRTAKHILLAFQSAFAPGPPPIHVYPPFPSLKKRVHAIVQQIEAVQAARRVATESSKDEEVELVNGPSKAARKGKGAKPQPSSLSTHVVVGTDKKSSKRALTDALEAGSAAQKANTKTYGHMVMEHAAVDTAALIRALFGDGVVALNEQVSEALAKTPSFGPPKAATLSAMLTDLDAQLATAVCALGVHYRLFTYFSQQRDDIAAALAGLPDSSTLYEGSTEPPKGKGKAKAKPKGPKSPAIISDRMDVDTPEEAPATVDEVEAEATEEEADASASPEA
ncbi:hypothetical protein BD626DRAFT_568394 [Schizophyllum amplum]|uniref:Uncharacterized protein n=1 Tax=Schizophyllum amplum TaxID=97359 RepID=A0A550CG38_9AGAR|nr:hypothetical protein BD626DRAFT_568394 [Auriculariopsis ampla]